MRKAFDGICQPSQVSKKVSEYMHLRQQNSRIKWRPPRGSLGQNQEVQRSLEVDMVGIPPQ